MLSTHVGQSNEATRSPDRRAGAPDGHAKETHISLKPGGGGIAIASFEGFTGELPYAHNNAAPGVELSLTNSGHSNPSGAPIPGDGTPILFLTAQVSGKDKVEFGHSARPALIHSASLSPSETYVLYLYQKKKQVAKLRARRASATGELRVATPLSGLAIAPAVPLVMELVRNVSTQPSPTPGPLSANPNELTFTSTASMKFAVEEKDYNGNLTAVTSDATVATVGPSSSSGPAATFSVTPIAVGSCTVTVTDARGNRVAVSVSVDNAIVIIDKSLMKHF
jgi:hypothetical protein